MLNSWGWHSQLHRHCVGYACFMLAVVGTGCVAVVGQETELTDAKKHLELELVKKLEGLRTASGAPGISVAIVLPDQTVVKVASGLVTQDESKKLRTSDKMMSGSIGKTYFAALALDQLHKGKFLLNDKISKYLGGRPQFARIPNAREITIGHLMRHQSGLPRYINVNDVWTNLMAEPDVPWHHGRQLDFIYDHPPLHSAGEGWAYSDTNYILLGLVLEEVVGGDLYRCIHKKFLIPHALHKTLPNDRREIAGLTQGHCHLFRRLGIPERVVSNDKFVFNPSMEWSGGGYASTADDLARWAHELYSGRLLGKPSIRAMKASSVIAPMLGPGTRYGLGVMIRKTDRGEMLGHDGVFPGYTATMGYFPEHEIAVALMVNADGPNMAQYVNFQRLVECAGMAIDGVGRNKP